MLRKTLVVLGIGAAATTIAPVAQAQSQLPPGQNTGSITLSGESLTTVEGRSAEEFFGKKSESSSDNGSPEYQTLSDVFQPVRGVNLIYGNPIDFQDEYELFKPSGDVNQTQRVNLEVPLGE
ncbi:MAG: hypothetical protein F6J86_04515 [Symploca sp. SIO1B1]|nr:hypothetical protein [Symploca sp. SIO2D2]NER46094.1 hypothetical protein [Symploca sp. SIO1A3]NER93097.1 hypothetical protein [Symploca sp. SIO1B1]